MTMNAIAIAIGAVTLPFLPSGLPNLAAWFRFGAGITSVASAVSQWNDQSGNGRNLLQGTGAAQPTLQADGSILFDGVNDFMMCNAFTLAQPETVYILCKQITWTQADKILDGNTADTMVIEQVNTPASSPNIEIYAGTVVGPNTNLPLNTYGAVCAVFNAASSSIQVGSNAAVTGNCGAGNGGGLTVGARAPGSAAWGNIQVKEVIVYAAAHDAATRAKVIAYLSAL